MNETITKYQILPNDESFTDDVFIVDGDKSFAVVPGHIANKHEIAAQIAALPLLVAACEAFSRRKPMRHSTALTGSAKAF